MDQFPNIPPEDTLNPEDTSLKIDLSYPGEKTFSSELLERKLISQSQLDIALDIQKKKGENLEKVILRLGWVTERAIIEVQSDLWDIPLLTQEITNKIDSENPLIIPQHLAERYRLCPLFKSSIGELWVAMQDPFNLMAIDDMKHISRCDIKPVIATVTEISDLIQKFYKKGEPAPGLDDEVVEDLMEELEEFKVEMDSGPAKEEEDLSQLNIHTDDPPVVKLVNYVIVQAINNAASDIHIEPMEDGLQVRNRIDGILFELIQAPERLKRSVISRLKILSGMDISERRVPQDGAFSIRLDSQEIDFRVSSLPTIWGEKIVMRILKKDAVLGVKLSDLGLNEENLQAFNRHIHAPHGMILVTGPTGSGKSTTLYTILGQVASPRKNVITTEDPVEYRLPGIQQVQVKSDIGFTFAAALRSILRQDPDIIMVGEMRDLETCEIGIRASLTGHLVFSTLHTNDAVGAVIRMIDMGVEPFLVASSVTMTVAQRLVRRICTNCKEEYRASENEVEILGLEVGGEVSLYRGKGCQECKNTGYKGRMAVHEVFELNPEIKRMIVAGATMGDIKKAAIENGMKSLRADGLDKAREGLTTIEEIVSVCIIDGD